MRRSTVIGLWAAALVAAGGSVWLAVDSWLIGLRVFGSVLGLALGAPFLVTAIAVPHRCRVVLEKDGVTIGRFLKGQSIRWSEIESASPSYFGIQIYKHDGSSVVCPAVQKSNLASWLGKRTRADDLADLITTRARGGGFSHPSGAR